MDNSNFDTKRLIVFGCVFVLLTVGVFISWAMTAKLNAASIASGTLVVESQRKKVQHLQGGWVKSIYVSEGQQVEAGDVLLELANSKAESDFRRLILRAVSLQSQHDRLDAELNKTKDVDWSVKRLPILSELDEVELSNIINTQQMQFQQASLRDDLRAGQFEQRKLLLDEQLRGVKFQLRAIRRQLDLLKQEIEMTAGLLKKGFVAKTRMLELQRHQASIEAQIAELDSEKEVLARQLVSLGQDYDTETIEIKQGVTAQLELTDKELRDVKQALTAATDIRSRVTIRSEHSGTVVGMNVHSVGGVVNAGDVMMEIVPNSDELIVEALIKPEDIDVVHQGLEAKVRLSSFNVRRTPPVQGEVIYVAADRLMPKKESQQTGYLVKVKLNKADIERLGDVELYPGMPTEVFILLESQTMWEYLSAPLFSSYYRAFRES
ncbi:HlyD family type I secretion periplasmic adaptor subunit [Photobacterium sanguinicancri]|uniref:HlyD family type I secretion periplasmic adaptor subunit n=1 Tax=Photobacterium sanguinicancri TaxID=875932 RepID=UPI0026E4497F|nr:HlyD family type I secretion periplasmic adaptor subunit [Photobacterium sanguinicancri]MDO6498607.1 HlyD family type I secretion periplasmic adaptor subunit [Photobacterium sanguinicancri]